MSTPALSNGFLTELFRLFFLKKSLIERCSQHLKYQYLPSAELKKIYKDIVNQYTLSNSLPTFGLLSELNKTDDKVIEVLAQIKESEIVDEQPLLVKLEAYIKEVRFVELHEQVIQLHTTDKAKAIELMAKGSQEIVEFSIFKDNGNFLKVFGDFQKVQLEKEIAREAGGISKGKIPYGILPLDLVTEGGMDPKETVLFILRSGVGKSTVLKFIGMSACRLGYRVLHVQLEGSSEECYDKYTQVWSAVTYSQAKNGNIETEKYHKLLSVANDMITLKQDIDIKSFEQFDEATMFDVRELVIQYIKENGVAPDMLILDSMDLAHPGDGLKYGADTQSIKMKINNSSRKFKNICGEFNMRGVTALQASEVKIDVWNDPAKHLTRSDAIGDKSVANSYSTVITGNQTLDEEKRGLMRLYLDKIRYYKGGVKILPIATNYDVGRFFNLSRTRKLFRDLYFKEEVSQQPSTDE